MPAYDFYCSDCDKSFTLVVTVTEYEKRKHPKCPSCDSSRHVQRKPSRFFAVTSKKS